jgi:hypothetical protein
MPVRETFEQLAEMVEKALMLEIRCNEQDTEKRP